MKKSYEKSTSGALQKLRFWNILGPRDHQNRTQHVLKPPGKNFQGLRDHAGSIYIQKSTFGDYNKGIIKSLGSWGGDFILVTGEKEDLGYFRDKGYNTIYDLEDLVYLN